MSNKDEALRARDLAEDWMKKSNFSTARRVAIKAQNMDGTLENISRMIMVCDVHCAAAEKFGDETDWYKILQVEQNADDNSIKSQYKKLALHLHPDKNKFPGAESAFKTIGEAKRVLLDEDRRRLHDMRRKPFERAAPAPSYQPRQAPATASYTQPVFQTNVNASNSFTAGLRPQNQQKPRAQPTNLSAGPNFWKAKSSRTSDENGSEKRKRKKIVESESSSSSSSSSSSEPDCYANPDFDFHNFNANRLEGKFSPGQIWALNSKEEDLPKCYAKIQKVEWEPVFKLWVKRLELESLPENVTKWQDNTMPVGCGHFTLKQGPDETLNKVTDFSHMIKTQESVGKNTYTVLPQTGEIWAMYNTWNDAMNGKSLRMYDYEIGQILDYGDSQIEVLMLERVEGFKRVFKGKVEGGNHVKKTFPRSELLRLSHYIPSFRLTGEKDGALRGYVELDMHALSIVQMLDYFL